MQVFNEAEKVETFTTRLLLCDTCSDPNCLCVLQSQSSFLLPQKRSQLGSECEVPGNRPSNLTLFGNHMYPVCERALGSEPSG